MIIMESRLFVLGILGIAILVFVTGCTSSKDSSDASANAVQSCVDLCLQMKDNTNMVPGPCLSDNNVYWTINDYVCDVAHNPRLPVDDQPENQCTAFGKTANRFVEVDRNCVLIRVA